MGNPDIDCHECECSFGPFNTDPCLACQECRHDCESFPDCDDCTTCKCLEKNKKREKRDMPLREAKKAAPTAEITTEYGYFIAGSFCWATTGPYLDELGINGGDGSPSPTAITSVWKKQKRLAALAGAVLSDDDMAVLVSRQRTVVLGPVEVVHVEVSSDEQEAGRNPRRRIR